MARDHLLGMPDHPAVIAERGHAPRARPALDPRVRAAHAVVQASFGRLIDKIATLAIEFDRLSKLMCQPLAPAAGDVVDASFEPLDRELTDNDYLRLIEMRGGCLCNVVSPPCNRCTEPPDCDEMRQLNELLADEG